MTVWLYRMMCGALALAALSGNVRAQDAAAQIQQRAGEYRLVVLGELHGTREMPKLVAELADRYSRDGRPLQLALEMPRSENLPLQGFLGSGGQARDIQLLRSRPFWQVSNNQHDGRRSRDMLELLEALRVLRMQGRDIQVFGYDVDSREGFGRGRNDAMASYLRTRFSQVPPAGRLLVLAGNAHAVRGITVAATPRGRGKGRAAAPAPAPLQAQPMAMQLADLDLYSVRVDALRGSAKA